MSVDRMIGRYYTENTRNDAELGHYIKVKEVYIWPQHFFHSAVIV